MVSKKRLDYGFNGLRAPIIPRAPRSIRRRSPPMNLVEDNKLCAFELLAAVAGKLLKESESSSSSNVAEGKVHGNDTGRLADDKILKSKSYDHGSCAESAFVAENSVLEHNLLTNFKGVPLANSDSILENTSAYESSGSVKKVDCNITLGICEDTNKLVNEPEKQSKDDNNMIGELTMADTSIKNQCGECVNSNVLINSEGSVQLPLYRDPVPGAFLRKHWNNVKLGIRDDDENSSGHNKFCTKIRPYRSQPRTGHRRIRKMKTSKYWKVAPKLKDCELHKTKDGMKTFYRYRKSIYERERCHQAPIKKRKLFDHSFAVAYDQDASSGSISNLPDNGIRGDKGSSAVILHRANGPSTTVQGHQKTKDPHVKFSIKSFKVPEFYIEVPETATVGLLKRTVMEAVTAILGGGIRVGIALEGKKVRDDGRTLRQAGISQSNTLDTLGFTLEPSFTHVFPSKTPRKHLPVSPCDADQLLPSSPATPMIDSGISDASIDTPIVNKLDDEFDNKDLISSLNTPKDALIDGTDVPESKALVPVPPMNAEALAAVPLIPKPKRSELSHRRTRRPFSVGEVEALVEAVEKLGTGRWRDVKMRAFENADHRTYVDLKDKWKTLVHTASIAPQQRRGEPVPQDLLDRVLSAHSYWAHHQPKQHVKHLVEPLKIEDAREEIVGA